MNSRFLFAVRSNRHCMVGLLTMVALAGCAVGPDFVRPVAPTFEKYDNDQAPPAVAPKSVAAVPSPIVMGSNLPAQWWELFHASALPEVLNQAITANQTLVAARATLAQAQETIIQAKSTWYPQVALGASAGQTVVGVGTNQYFYGPQTTVSNQFSLGPSISYTFDIVGLTARTVEQAKANAEDQH